MGKLEGMAQSGSDFMVDRIAFYFVSSSISFMIPLVCTLLRIPLSCYPTIPLSHCPAVLLLYNPTAQLSCWSGAVS